MPFFRPLKRTFVAVEILLLATLIAACSKSPQQDTDSDAMHMPPPTVSVVEIQASTVPVSYEFIGQTLGSHEIEIRARVAGHIEQRLYQEGAFVKSGQPLFQLDARPFELAVATAQAAVTTAEADIAQTEAAANQAKRERERMAGLAASNAISRKEADDASSAAQIADAAVQVARARLEQAQAQLEEAQLNLAYTTIKAPVSGMTGRALQQQGSWVNPNTGGLLTTLIKLDPLYVTFNLAEGDRQRIDQELAEGTLELPKQGFKVRLLQRDGKELGQEGHINFVSSSISRQTGTQEMRAQFANPKGKIKSGLFVRVILEGGTRPNAITVPQHAVLEGANGKTVMLAKAGENGTLISQPHPIKVGDWVNLGDEKQWLVVDGLKPGDKIIIDNLMKLRPGAPINLAQSPSTMATKE